MEEVVRALSVLEVPVLASTARTLAQMRAEEDRLTARDISRVVLRDPLMTLRVLRYAEGRRGARQLADITTVEHAIMMHGITTFLRDHSRMTTIESVLENNGRALSGALRVISRAQHASAFARSIAAHRHDIESDEVVVGALLHDLAELLLWCHRPDHQREIRYLVDNAQGLRSAAAQRLVLGFTHIELQLALAAEWRLPALLCRLMDDDHADHPRVVNVMTAAALARHLAHGWNDPALPDDYKRIEKVAGISAQAARRLVSSAAITAARQWESTGVRPAASWLPLERGQVEPEELGLVPPDAIDVRTCRRALDILGSSLPGVDEDAWTAWTLYGIRFGLGLRRCMYAQVTKDGRQLVERFQFGPGGTQQRYAAMPMPLSENNLFGRLMTKIQFVRTDSENRDRLIARLVPAQRAVLSQCEFLAMSIMADAEPRGLIIADLGEAGRPIPANVVEPFKALCFTLSQRLTALRSQ